MTADLGVLLPVRIETRFKGSDLWLRVIPDEPWFVRRTSASPPPSSLPCAATPRPGTRARTTRSAG